MSKILPDHAVDSDGGRGGGRIPESLEVVKGPGDPSAAVNFDQLWLSGSSMAVTDQQIAVRKPLEGRRPRQCDPVSVSRYDLVSRLRDFGGKSGGGKDAAEQACENGWRFHEALRKSSECLREAASGQLSVTSLATGVLRS